MSSLEKGVEVDPVPIKKDQVSIPELDLVLFKPSPKLMEFLRASIAQDEDELMKRILAVQKE